MGAQLMLANKPYGSSSCPKNLVLTVHKFEAGIFKFSQDPNPLKLDFQLGKLEVLTVP